jgi:hypothetical protein
MIDMKDLKIENPEDWHTVSNDLRKLMRTMPQFYNDFLRIKKTVDNKIKDLSVLDVKLRRGDSLYYKQLRKDKLDEINETIRMFSKMYLIASLSKR